MGRYNLVLFLLTYLLPILGMVGCYARMGLQLWRDNAATSSAATHPALVRSRHNKKRVINQTAECFWLLQFYIGLFELNIFHLDVQLKLVLAV